MGFGISFVAMVFCFSVLHLLRPLGGIIFRSSTPQQLFLDLSSFSVVGRLSLKVGWEGVVSSFLNTLNKADFIGEFDRCLVTGGLILSILYDCLSGDFMERRLAD